MVQFILGSIEHMLLPTHPNVIQFFVVSLFLSVHP